MKKVFVAFIIAMLITAAVTAALCEDDLFIGRVTGINAAEGTITVTSSGRNPKTYTVYAEGYKMDDLVSINKDTLEVSHYAYPEKTLREKWKDVATVILVIGIVILLIMVCINEESMENLLDPLFIVVLILVIASVIAVIVLR